MSSCMAAWFVILILPIVVLTPNHSDYALALTQIYVCACLAWIASLYLEDFDDEDEDL